MTRFRRPSAAAQRVLAALLSSPSAWRYGYDLTKQTRVGAGTLYPLLDRWSRQGLLEAEWRASDAPGRPARHAYKLTTEGVGFAREWTRAATASPRLGLAT